LNRGLIEEAIASSQLEGASTTRHVAKEMLQTKRLPRNKDEQMIYNNYLAMRFIQDHRNEKLTPALIFELHKIVTEKTLEDERKAGKFRESNDDIRVIDITTNDTLHTPPEASELPNRLEQLCDFANTKQEDIFIHPAVKAIILHFTLAYDHPFVDGNGRTARALFYWYMAKENYWLMEYCSISSILKKASAKYSRAFLYTETDDSDLTYFIIHQLDVIKKSINSLHNYLDKKVESVQDAKKLLRNNKILQNNLNSRQMILLSHALKHPRFVYDIKTHQTKHAITYETARKDLMGLSSKIKLLDRLKQGRAYVYQAPVDLNERLANLESLKNN
jgi:Fic family protein